VEDGLRITGLCRYIKPIVRGGSDNMKKKYYYRKKPHSRKKVRCKMPK
jgi:hypothetical protein